MPPPLDQLFFPLAKDEQSVLWSGLVKGDTDTQAAASVTVTLGPPGSGRLWWIRGATLIVNPGAGQNVTSATLIVRDSAGNNEGYLWSQSSPGLAADVDIDAQLQLDLVLLPTQDIAFGVIFNAGAVANLVSLTLYGYNTIQGNAVNF